MRITWRWSIPLLLIPVAAFTAWRQDSHPPMRMPVGGPAWTDLMGSMDKMDAAMASVEPSGDGDVDFVKLMLPHHQAAIDMARTQLLHGKDPQMRRLAQEIITDQQSEIQLMQLWLNHREPAPSAPGRASDTR